MEEPLSPVSADIDVDEEESLVVDSRKRPNESRASHAPNGSPAKRLRLSNGFENGFPSTPMELDHVPNGNGDGLAYPSPKEVERSATPALTKGPERGTQVEQVADLAADTTFFDLSDSPTTSGTVLLHCAWSPRELKILATAGTDAQARLWSVEPPSQLPDKLNQTPPYLNLIRDGTSSHSSITAMAWSTNGAAIAVAADATADDHAKLRIFDAEGAECQVFEGFEPPIICLKWAPSNLLLLALMPDKEGTGITVYTPTGKTSCSFVVHQSDPSQQIVDAVWITDSEFVVCGGDILQAFSCSQGVIVPVRKFETREDHGLLSVAFDPQHGLIATANESGTVDVSARPLPRSQTCLADTR